jgi:hypothetical protein
MTEQTITLNQIETKSTKAGQPMWACSTSVGKISIFNKDLADELSKLIGKNIVVEIVSNGQYKNLTKIIQIAANQVPINNNIPEPKNPRIVSATMLISYAKDLCIAGKIELKDIPSQSKELLALYEEMLDIKFE